MNEYVTARDYLSSIDDISPTRDTYARTDIERLLALIASNLTSTTIPAPPGWWRSSAWTYEGSVYFDHSRIVAFAGQPGHMTPLTVWSDYGDSISNFDNDPDTRSHNEKGRIWHEDDTNAAEVCALLEQTLRDADVSSRAQGAEAGWHLHPRNPGRSLDELGNATPHRDGKCPRCTPEAGR